MAGRTPIATPGRWQHGWIDTGTEQLRVERHGGVATLVLDNQDKRNALSVEMQAALPPLLRRLDGDGDVRVVVVRGGGERAFAAGMDISEFGERRTAEDDRARYEATRAAMWAAWTGFTKPVIAAVRGHCIGGGLLTALHADVRLAGDDARFAVTAARLGLGFGLDGVEALAATVGTGWAAELLLSARTLDAAEAEQAGLVNRVVPAAELFDEAHALAGTIAAGAPLTVAALTAALRQLRRPPAERDRGAVAAMVEACFRSADYREGQRAFAERRPPVFEGR